MAAIVTGAVLPLVAIAATSFFVATSGAQTAEARPDLGMAQITDLSVATAGGRTQLRFSATIVNVGSAPFELRAVRSGSGSPFDVVQRLGASDVPAPGVELVFGGDGHNHWHVKDLERYELVRVDNGVKVGTSAKSGFCFFDTTPYRSLPGTPGTPVYRSAGCGTQGSLEVTMGLSVGWGDTYPSTLPDQYIDITNLTSGRYRLLAEADPLNWFGESDERNNGTWVELSIVTNKGGKTRLRIHGYGPAA